MTVPDRRKILVNGRHVQLDFPAATPLRLAPRDMHWPAVHGVMEMHLRGHAACVRAHATIYHDPVNEGNSEVPV